jgi:hypothetical protein
MFSNSRSILSNGNSIHIIWYDNRNGVSNNEIYYKHSTNNGLNWSSDIKLTDNPARSEQPALGINNTTIYAVWQDDRDGSLLEIYYKRSTNSGNSWESDFRLTNDPGLSQNPSISVNGLNIYVAWQERRNGNDEIYYKLSTDGGVSWGSDIRLTNDAATSSEPCIISVGSSIQVVWFDDRDGNQEIYHKYSTNYGTNWSSDIRLTNNGFQSNHPQICISGLSVHLVWSDTRDGSNAEIYYKKSTNLGISWSNDTRLTFNSARSYGPAMCVSGLIIHVVWYDERTGNFEIYYKGSSDNGVNWGNDTQLTNATNLSFYPDVSISNSNINLIWCDDRDGNMEIYFKQNPTGNIAPPNIAPILESPLNNSIGISLTPLMNWDSVANSNSFRIQLSEDSSFISKVLDSIITISQLIIPSNVLLNNTKYYWKVCGNNNGGNGPWSTIWNFTTLQSFVNSPIALEKWISGEKDTIKWSGTNWSLVNIKLTLNFGTPLQSNYTIVSGVPNGSQNYIWSIPENFLSFRTKITIENSSNPSQNIESNIFRLKPYLLTKVTSDSTYYEYRKDRDQWGFWNIDTQMFSSNWYQQFNYRGIDPYTNQHYSPTQGWFTFLRAKSWNFPDWISMVRTFTVNGCYVDLEKPIYSPYALTQWNMIKDYWSGSCFGIAISNALVFKNKNEFLSKYPNFPQFSYPNTVQASDEVRRTINELFTHQTGQPHTNYVTQYGLKKSVKETLNELKEMLIGDDPQVKTLSFRHNYPDSTGGHAIVAYKLKKDIADPNTFYIYISDNANPESNIPIEIDISENNGNGTWYYANFHYWGGDSLLFLRDPAITYLSTPIFNINDSILQVMIHPLHSSILIKDIYGNITGHNNDTNCNNIPLSIPLIFENGHTSYPYGYELKKRQYFLELRNFLNDTIYTYFSNGNNTFSYERYNTQYSQIDNLIYEDGLMTFNSDTTTKYISLTNIIKENNLEKFLGITSLNLEQNDTLKLELIDSNKHKLISFGSSKLYDIHLNLAATEFGEFFASDILLPLKSTHIFIPNWQNLNTSQLIILVDLGNNGTIDDTMRINNQIIGINIDNEIPYQYNLSQNYPNPFNPKTSINFEIPQKENVKIIVYDILGREISTIINEVINAGRYKIEWNAEQYSSGVYFCKMSTANYEKTIKIVLLK